MARPGYYKTPMDRSRSVVELKDLELTIHIRKRRIEKCAASFARDTLFVTFVPVAVFSTSI
jgi:hypothetical protein